MQPSYHFFARTREELRATRKSLEAWLLGATNTYFGLIRDPLQWIIIPMLQVETVCLAAPGTIIWYFQGTFYSEAPMEYNSDDDYHYHYPMIWGSCRIRSVAVHLHGWDLATSVLCTRPDQIDKRANRWVQHRAASGSLFTSKPRH